ncbi:MAG: hypothetical protein V4724_28495 [Pseudomonadota bacterium]
MKTLLCAASVIAALLAPAAHATPILQDAVISATYNGAADAMLGLDHLYAQEAGSNVTHIDADDNPFNPEFLSGDYLFAVDISTAGAITVYNNGPVPAGAYRMTLDFGNSLGKAITGFSLFDNSLASGIPGLTLLNGHAVGIDLGGIGWPSGANGGADYASFSGQLSFDAPSAVPVPQTALLLLTGLAALAGVRRPARKA